MNSNSEKIENGVFAALGIVAMVIVIIALPALVRAATYQFVDTSGVVQTITADTAGAALDAAQNRAEHSGVMLLATFVMSGSDIAPTISNVSVNESSNSAVVNWNTDQNAKGVVYYSSSPLVLYGHPHTADVSGATASTDNNYRTSQDVSISNLSPNTVYYYLIYTTDQNGNVSVTIPLTFKTTN